MKKARQRWSRKAGLPPGTPVYVGQIPDGNIKLSLIDYNSEKTETHAVNSIEECFNMDKTQTVTWINIDGIHNEKLIDSLGKHYKLHPLTIEDILNTQQRPKVELYEDYIFIILKMMIFDKNSQKMNTEQVSLILKQNLVITFQEKAGDVLGPLRQRISNNQGRIRKEGAGYLSYAIIDCIVDSYFTDIESIEDAIEELENLLLNSPTSDILPLIHALKRELIIFRKALWPMRSMFTNMEHLETKLLSRPPLLYLRDLRDHIFQVIDSIESCREMVTGLQELYHSCSGNKMNEIMKFLTIIGTIFIPLTFIAGIYGMNFQNMPELTWSWGYFAVMGVMFFVGISLVVYFKKKKWL